MKQRLVLILIILSLASFVRAQSGVRIFGAQQFQVDDNIVGHPKSFLSTLNGSLGIDNTGNVVPGTFPSVCAILDLSSTTRGFLPPRVTTAQELAICGGTPPQGLVVYNTTTGTLDVYGPFGWGASGWALNGNNLSGGTPATPNQYFGSNNNFDVVMKTNSIERFRLGSNTALTTASMTMGPNATTGFNLLGNTIGFSGINIDMNTNPAVTGAAGLSISMTGQAGAVVNGINAQVGSSGGSINNAAITSSVFYNGSGSGQGISSAAWLNAPAGSEGDGGVFVAYSSNAATGGTLIGSRSIADYNAGTTGSVIGTAVSAKGGANSSQATGAFISSNGNGTAAPSVGVSVSSSGSSSSNIGEIITAAGTNSVGIQVIAGSNTAVQTQNGRTIWGNAGPTAVASGGAIPTTAITVVVGDNGVALSAATATLPAGIEGQVIYITTADPDGVKITVGLSSVTIASAEVGRFMYIGGQWRLEH
ncbi:MAG TPA: hypothetical protein VEW28_07585 [Candidatus Kapabacteria bacterium]|nr:hypothetical protein [Candidatus Kapabacteria bacterium]